MDHGDTLPQAYAAQCLHHGQLVQLDVSDRDHAECLLKTGGFKMDDRLQQHGAVFTLLAARAGPLGARTNCTGAEGEGAS